MRILKEQDNYKKNKFNDASVDLSTSTKESENVENLVKDNKEISN